MNVRPGSQGSIVAAPIGGDHVANPPFRLPSLEEILAIMTVGRYAALLRSGGFDGYVNIGAFNCAPANSASAVIHSLSLRADTPYAVIEADGNCITTSQLGQLETVAAQCRRRRAAFRAGAGDMSRVPS
jgi:hypothetical protein